MQNILFLTQILPYPLVGGAKTRAYHILQHLAQQHRVTLISFTRQDDQPAHIQHLQTICHAVHTIPLTRSTLQDSLAIAHSLLSNKPISIVRDRNHAMHTLLRQCTAQTPFNIVHADQTAMAQYGLFVQQIQSPPPRLILDQHNAMHHLVQRQSHYQTNLLQKLIWRREAALFAHYEANLLRRYDHILTVTAADKGALLHLLPPDEGIHIQDKMHVLPICVDPTLTPPIPRPDPSHHIIHIGTMFWPPNIEGVLWFANQVLPLIIEQVPTAHFTIVGKNPPASVLALTKPGAPLANHITITGFVDDPTPLLARSSAFIVPVRAGGGMRVKILDGWQWGLPIVSTSVGAEGISIRPGHNILLADTPTHFAQATSQLLTQPHLASLIATAGRNWVTENYAWQTTYPQIDPLYA